MSLKHTLTASAIMLLTMVLLLYINHAEDIHPNKPFSSFPTQIDEWRGKKVYFEKQILSVLGVDDYFIGNYQNSNGREIQLYVGFYQSQREGDLIHSPKNCMPGAGWNIVRTSIEELETPNTSSGTMKAIRLMVQKGEQKQIVLYWFQSRGRIISSEYMQKIYLVIDSVTRRRTDGSFVRLITPVINNDEQRALNHLKGFIRLVMPHLNEYIPS